LIQSLSIAVRSPATWLAVIIGLVCIVLHFTGMAETWHFDRQRFEDGGWHLLLTGNFVHLGQSHMWLNVGTLVLIWGLVWENFNAWQWALITLVSSLLVTVGLYLFDPDILHYYGFSGALHGMIIAGCIADIRNFPKLAIFVLCVVTAKLTYEQTFGAMPHSEAGAGGAVAVNSHLYGAIGGVMGPILLGIEKWFGKPKAAETE